MNTVSSFVKLDYNIIKPGIKTLVWMPLLGIFMCFAMKTTLWLTMYLALAGTMAISYPFVLGETNKMSNLYGTLPLTRRDIVRGRHAFALITITISCAFNLGLALLSFAFLEMKGGYAETILSFSIIIPLLSLTTVFQYPMFFKWGYNKGKFPAFLLSYTTVILFMLWNLASQSGEVDLSFLSAIPNPLLLLIPAVIVAIALLGVSYKISCRVYERCDIES